ncbi:FadR/GntR family transcriptional regulator [Cellvibrio japonicus]|uniref:Transcriptional regulator, GntR family n=1 Tax=Cellvibrio japonicus (strain Ueda107) TaxID=498211 RepID=B3PKS6_CELJU|nr:FadR/GntR family transcriptional regulator [Cellvibrio japonicus]ACE85286.1 transcriptional regulator, GntR family [Cellvibrio japonicus Ueda107]QEI11488.1 FadR family transcriptional regulator [Cellvibrio japonicus]QEI15062.1 FadR family transcriptional regulator [Cellvibrio japonicus]QEI18642.1 FadR family transcriptional regulator [Cellvibrio japonicus]
MALLDRNFNLSQRMVQELGRTIICGEFTDNGLPTEAELCEKFGVSRSAVREAVKMLSAKGLVSSKPRQGIRVLPEDQWNIFDPDLLRWMLESKPTLSVLKEFLQVRIAIEPEAAALAARYADPGKVDQIEKALERMRKAPDNSPEDLEADIAFHVSILYASNNRFYIRLRDFISTALRVSISHTSPIKGNHEGIVEDHAKVLNAIKNRNAERAKHSMLLLIDEALNFIEDSIAAGK